MPTETRIAVGRPEAGQGPHDDSLVQQLLVERVRVTAGVDVEEVPHRRNRRQAVLAQQGCEAGEPLGVDRAPPRELGVLADARERSDLRR